MDQMRHRIVSVVMLLAIPGWLYLWLGSQIDAARVVVFVAGYLLLGVALTGQRTDREPRSHVPSSRRPPT